MIFTTDDFEALPEAAKNSLTHLRGLRDKLAEDIAYEAEGSLGESARRIVDEFVTFRSPNGSFNTLNDVFTRRNDDGSRATLRALRLLVFRVARIERERCGLPFRE